MNIGCDLDGVIIDHRRNQRRLLERRGFVLPVDEVSKETIKRLLAPEDYKKFKQELYGKMSISAEEIPEARRSLQHLLEKGHELRLISRRSEGQHFARKWLKDHGFGTIFHDSNIHFVSADKDKDTICRKFYIQLHIDDSPEVLEVLTFPQHKILFGTSFPAHTLATAAAPTWEALTNHIARLS